MLVGGGEKKMKPNNLTPQRCKKCNAIIGYVTPTGHLVTGGVVIEKATHLYCRKCGTGGKWSWAGARWEAALSVCDCEKFA